MSPSAKQALFVPLGVGLETDVDDKLLPLGKVLEIENASVFETGDLVKRFGSNQMSGLIQPGGGALPQAWQLATHKGALVSLSVPGPTPIATYSPTKGAWSVPDPATNDRRGPISVALKKVSANAAANVGSSYTAYGAGYYFVAYRDQATTAAVRFDVIDAATNHRAATTLVNPAPDAIYAFRVRFCNGYGVLCYEDSNGAVKFVAVLATTLATTTATAAGVGGGNPVDSNKFDAYTKDASTISVVVRDGTGNAAAVDFVPTTLVTTAWGPRDASGASISISLGVCWIIDLGASGRIAIGSASTASGVRVHWNIPTSGATRQAATSTTADATVGLQMDGLVGHTISADATGAWQVVYTLAAAFATNNVTVMAIRTGGVVTTAFTLYRSLTLQSQTWTAGGDFFAMFAFQSASQGNTYVLRLPVTTVTPALAPPLAQFAIGASGFSPLTQVTVVSATTVAASIAFKIRFDATVGVNPNATGIEIAVVSHLAAQDTTMGRAAEAADSLLVPGASIAQFDGRDFGELGFAYSPEAASATAAAGGGLNPNSNYWYVYLYSRQDAQGRLWRGGISVPQVFATGAGQGTLNHLIPTLRVSGWSKVNVEIYRGAAGVSALLQKVGVVSNTIGADAVAFSDSTPDATEESGEDLYTTGGGLSNDTIPGSLFVFMAKRRVWFISADNPSELWFSNVIQPGKGLVFSEVNIQRIEDENGPLYGAAPLDDKVVAIKNSSVYAFNGDGPDNDGVGSFPPAELVVHGIGTTNPQSVTTGPNGVIFDSTSARPGIQMIDRSLSVAKNPDGMYWGAAVQRYNGETIVSTIVVPEQSQIRIHTISGRTLVLDLISHIWSTFTGQPSVCAVALNGAAIWATGSATIRQEDPTGATYTDSGVGYNMRVASPWLQVGAVRGFERVTMFQGVGRTAGDHSLALSVYRDLDDNTLVTSKTFAMTVAGRPLWDWEWVPRVQRFGAMKMVVVETSTTAGPKINGFTALLGVKPGLTRRGDGARL